MDKGYWQSAQLTNNLFWYAVSAGLAQALLSLLPNAPFLLEVISFGLGAIGFITILIASTLAYSYRRQTEAVLLTHYQYLIRTLWLMVLFSLISMLFVINSVLGSVTTALSDLSNPDNLQTLAAVTNDSNNWVSAVFNLLTNLWLFARVYKARKLLKNQAPIANTWWI